MNKFAVNILLLLAAGFTVSCGYFKKEDAGMPIARVENSYLYKEDVAGLVFENASPEDSTTIVNNYINRWATKQLLINKAKINLTPQEQQTYNTMVQEYQNDLYIEAYKNAIVARQLDSSVTEAQYKQFYAGNKDNLRVNDVLLKMRYLHLPPNYSDLGALIAKFRRFSKEDKTALNLQNLQFLAHNLNDSVWVKRENLLKALPVLRTNNEQALKNLGFKQLQDSLGVYLVHISGRLNTNGVPPLSYSRPVIKQILINKRRLGLIKKLETDITKDAIENENFEIYYKK